MPGYVRDRTELARWLASADIYVSAMADETFGVSIVEAQASGLPVVGVAAGAMLDRVTDEMGRLGPVGDSDAMARKHHVGLERRPRREWPIRRAPQALQFSWERSMEALFGEVYPGAFAKRAEQRLATPAASRRSAGPYLTGSTGVHLGGGRSRLPPMEYRRMTPRLALLAVLGGALSATALAQGASAPPADGAAIAAVVRSPQV